LGFGENGFEKNVYTHLQRIHWCFAIIYLGRTFGDTAPHPKTESLVDESPVILLGSVAKASVLESEGLYGMPSEHAAFVTYLFVHPGSSWQIVRAGTILRVRHAAGLVSTNSSW
jgi:hypothetical protein